MSFPISPTNGQAAVLNGITYTFNSTDNAWVRVVGALTATTNLNISGSTASTSTTTGALTVTGGVGIGGDINFSGNLYQNGVLFTGSGGSGSGVDPIIVNDISTRFNSVNTVFTLQQDQAIINTIVDSKDLEVVINGSRLTPYVVTITYPWLMDYDSFRGFRVSGSNLIIYNAPAIGDSAAVIVRSSSASVQKRKYPYSATTIALGD
mgnify:CR=1 FL=1